MHLGPGGILAECGRENNRIYSRGQSMLDREVPRKVVVMPVAYDELDFIARR